MVAFLSPSTSAVDASFAAGIIAGGTNEGNPAFVRAMAQAITGPTFAILTATRRTSFIVGMSNWSVKTERGCRKTQSCGGRPPRCGISLRRSEPSRNKVVASDPTTHVRCSSGCIFRMDKVFQQFRPVLTPAKSRLRRPGQDKIGRMNVRS